MARRRDLFARLSLDYADHPKIAGLSDGAFRAHVEMILYSRRYLTDGQIAKQIAKRWPERVLAELCTNDPEHPSLQLADDGSFVIYGFSEMQETREEVQVKSQIRAEAGRLGGLAKSKQIASKVSSKNVPETETETEKKYSSEVADATARPDVIEILDHLDQRIRENDPTRRLPSRTKKNLAAARLLIDRDGHTVDQVKAAIDFSQADEFWRSNVLSMSKLRDKYDQLRAQAMRKGNLRAVEQPRTSTNYALLPKCPTCNAPQEITHYDECDDQTWRPSA